jgi:long-chain acyl-CoA synthetase
VNLFVAEPCRQKDEGLGEEVVGLIADTLRESAQKHKYRPCLHIFSEGSFSSLTYGELDRLVDFLSASIIARGIEPGQRICIVSENRPEWVISYLGILRAGCAVVPLDSLSRPEDIRYLVRRSQARIVFSSGRFVKDLEELRDYGGFCPEIVCFGRVQSSLKINGIGKLKGLEKRKGSGKAGGSGKPEGFEKGEDLEGADDSGTSEGFRAFDDVLASGENALKEGGPSERRVPEDEEAVLIFTSGTTGAAKGVVLSHRNICFDVTAVLGSVPLKESDRLLSVLPLHHTLESTAGMLAPLMRGASITYARSWRSKEILADLCACKATVFISVPLMYEKMAAGIKRAIAQSPAHRRLLAKFLLWLSASIKKRLGVDAGASLLKSLRKKAGLDCLRIAISGAAPLSAAVQEFFGVLGVPILEGYGLTEASPVVSVSAPGKLRPGSVGPPIPGVEVKIHNPDAQGIGEILVRGDNVMKGYLESPEATAKVLSGDWLHTGDLGVLDESGYLYIRGRSKSVIVTQAGKKIFPEEVETVLAGSPFVSEVMVVGAKSSTSGREEVHALIYPDFEQLQLYADENNIRLDEEQIKDILRSEIRKLCARLPDYKRVKNLTIRNEEFPKTSTKKIKRHALVEDATFTSG